MKLLTWDASTTKGLVGLYQIDKAKIQVLQEITYEAGTKHSELLLKNIDQVVQDSDLDWPEIDAFAVGIGPGSFTGIRIALVTAKTLAWTHANRPVYTFSSLRAVGCSSLGTNSDQGRQIMVTHPACRGEEYVFVGSIKELLEGQGIEKVLRHEEIKSLIKSKNLQPDHLLGDWCQNYFDSAPALQSKLGGPGFHSYLHQIVQTQQPQTHDRLQPNYLRESDAERNLRQRQP